MALALPLVTLFALLIEATSPVLLHLMVEQKMLLWCRDGCFEHFPLCPHLLNLMLMFVIYFAIGNACLGKTRPASHLIEVFEIPYELCTDTVTYSSIWTKKCCTAGKQPLSAGKQAPSALDIQRR